MNIDEKCIQLPPQILFIQNVKKQISFILHLVSQLIQSLGQNQNAKITLNITHTHQLNVRSTYVFLGLCGVL